MTKIPLIIKTLIKAYVIMVKSKIIIQKPYKTYEMMKMDKMKILNHMYIFS